MLTPGKLASPRHAAHGFVGLLPIPTLWGNSRVPLGAGGTPWSLQSCCAHPSEQEGPDRHRGGQTALLLLRFCPAGSRSVGCFPPHTAFFHLLLLSVPTRPVSPLAKKKNNSPRSFSLARSPKAERFGSWTKHPLSSKVPGADSSRRNRGGRIPKFKPTSWQHSCPSHMAAGGAAPGCPNFLLVVPWANTANPASTRANVKEVCRRGKQNKTRRKKKMYQKAIKKLSKPGLSGAGWREGAGAGAAGTGWHLAAREPGKQQSTRPPAPASRGRRQWQIEGQALGANKPRTVRGRRR